MSLEFSSANLNLSVLEIDGFKLDISEKEQISWNLTFGPNICATKAHSKNSPHKFGDGCNFAFASNSKEKLKLELLNGRKKPIGTIFYSLETLIKKQKFTFQQLEGAGGNFNIEFKLGHEMLPYSIIRSEPGEYWQGIILSSFKQCTLTLCSVNLIVYENNEVFYVYNII
jgi:hypothetical protein